MTLLTEADIENKLFSEINPKNRKLSGNKHNTHNIY